MRSSITEIFAAAVLVAILSVAAVAGYIYYESSSSKERTQRALDQLSQQHDQLKEEYRSIVKKTAVTELQVKGDQLDVLVRRLDGSIQRISTPYDPSREIYVDYVILDSRLLIRRVFDDQTAPSKATLINPLLNTVNWDEAHAQHGKAIYRSLDDGRWIITVTGNGSLGLVKVDEDAPIRPEPAPKIKDVDENSVVEATR